MGSGANGSPCCAQAAPQYRLFAVLVHAGYTADSGHYYCYVRSAAGGWFEMNDDEVTRLDDHCEARTRVHIA
jgi:ubiquitin C-terminal hydrolase